MEPTSRMRRVMRRFRLKDEEALRQFLAREVQEKGHIPAARHLRIAKDTLTVWLLKLGIRVERVARIAARKEPADGDHPVPGMGGPAHA